VDTDLKIIVYRFRCSVELGLRCHSLTGLTYTFQIWGTSDKNCGRDLGRQVLRTDTQTHRHIDRQTDRQTDIHSS